MQTQKKFNPENSLIIEFQNSYIEDILDGLTNESEKPALIFVHNPESRIIDAITKTIFQSQPIADLINLNFQPVGVLTSNSEISAVEEFCKIKEAPLFLCLRRTKLDKLEVISVISF